MVEGRRHRVNGGDELRGFLEGGGLDEGHHVELDDVPGYPLGDPGRGRPPPRRRRPPPGRVGRRLGAVPAEGGHALSDDPVRRVTLDRVGLPPIQLEPALDDDAPAPGEVRRDRLGPGGAR